MTNGNGHKFMYRIVCPLLGAAIVGLIVMYRDVGIAKDDVVELEASDARQQEILDEIPALTERLKALDAQLIRSDATFDRIADYIRQDSIDDAKSHHNHPR